MESVRDAIEEAIRPALEYYEKSSDEAPVAAMGGVAEEAPVAAMGLSVVVCTRNRPGDIERCIKALMESEDKDFELIVVDNAPEDDRTKKILSQITFVRYIREERKGLDIARNTGGQAATRAIIAYTDDDVVVDRGWTGRLKRCFADPSVMAVTGLVIPARLDTVAQYLFERYWGFNRGYLPRVFDQRYFSDHLAYGVQTVDIGAGANMAFRREIFELAGWFDERLDVGAAGCNGDSEIWYRVLAEGWNCQYLPDLVVYHHHRASKEELNGQLYNYMRGHVCALLVQNERYGHGGNRRKLYRGLPQYYLERVRDRLFRRDRRSRETFGTYFREIRGCISGWWYYHSGRSGGGAGIPQGDVLRQEVKVTERTVVSVIIPCYNHAQYLGAAIRSVLDQSFGRTEIVVVDDGSTDGTAELCRRYKEVRYIRVERVGPSVARNIGVQVCRGEFVVFLDADDLLYANALELNLYYFGLYPRVAFVSGGHDRIDEQGEYLEGTAPLVKDGDNYLALLLGNYIAMEATVLYRREVLARFCFNPAVRACEDYDLNLRIARQLPVFGHAHKIAAYRIHGENRSKDRKMMVCSAIEVLKKQKKFLTNGEERRNYRQGLKNWHIYYSDNH
jgi:glycosyltransferase involved in cell wall biosynthesis